ncbi:unnamed protein product [Rhizophagus irregularis]|uniref:Uncharacterized protein n=1 Tax=Rhizophagus irregularis TaxID=588596 RepID=A0A915ZJP0_9GLOM|nr:unnamed protein product [Rhizophagus irregularis]
MNQCKLRDVAVNKQHGFLQVSETPKVKVNLPAKKIRKNKIPEILFNCFAVPSDLVGIIGVQHIAVVRIDDKESIHFLRKEI